MQKKALHLWFPSLISVQFEISGNSTSFELTDLLPGENYEMTLQAINLAGIGATTIEFTQPVSGEYNNTLVAYTI